MGLKRSTSKILNENNSLKDVLAVDAVASEPVSANPCFQRILGCERPN